MAATLTLPRPETAGEAVLDLAAGLTGLPDADAARPLAILGDCRFTLPMLEALADAGMILRLIPDGMEYHHGILHVGLCDPGLGALTPEFVREAWEGARQREARRIAFEGEAV